MEPAPIPAPDRDFRQVARTRLARQDRAGRGVFTTADLHRILPEATPRRVRTLVQHGCLWHPARGLYVNPQARCLRRGYLLEELAAVLRRDHTTYLSLESVLCEYGAISQLMPDRITVMTTGAGGTRRTTHGVIEFTHTARPRAQLAAGLLTDPRRPLPLARLDVALRDLRQVGRNVGMVDPEEYRCLLAEHGIA